MSIENQFSHHSFLYLIVKTKSLRIPKHKLKLTPHPLSFIWNNEQEDNLRKSMDSQIIKDKLDVPQCKLLVRQDS